MTARVLVVDDEPGVRVTLAANLELEGFEVMEAETGEQAFELAQTIRFDLIVTDIRMPGMNGVELFRTLRQTRVMTPVVLMTGFAMEDLVKHALEEGAFTVLNKPFDVAHAVQTVTRASKVPLVLVVDDAEPVTTTTVASLRAAGIRAGAALSAAEAMQSMRSGDVDVCVLDLVMPGVSGAELAKQLKGLDPKIVVIAMSGQDVPELIRSVTATGAYTFVQKPFQPRELIRLIALARGQEPGAGHRA